MSTTLRVTLLIVSILTVFWILRKIRANRMRQEDTLFWICFAILMAILGVFPQIMSYLSTLLGVQSTANLLFLVVIALLAEKLFSLSVAVSKLQNQIEILSAELAIRTKESADSFYSVNQEDKQY